MVVTSAIEGPSMCTRLEGVWIQSNTGGHWEEHIARSVRLNQVG
jgi:hypothetical protein